MSLALGVCPLLTPRAVARLVGVDDSSTAVAMVRAVGGRELGHGVALLLGSPALVWTRVSGDALDLAMLVRAASSRHGVRRKRVAFTIGVIGMIGMVDLFVALKTRRTDDSVEASEQGRTRLRASVTINRPVHDVYTMWRDLEHLPNVMGHVRAVERRGDGVFRWEVSGPLGRTVAWEAETTADDVDDRVSWRSRPGGDVENSGYVHFLEAPNGRGTELRVVVDYSVPGGAIGDAAAKLLGVRPEQLVRDELRRVKQVLETGDVVRTEASSGGVRARQHAMRRAARPRPSKSWSRR